MCAVGFVQASITGSRPRAGKSRVVAMGHDLDVSAQQDVCFWRVADCV